MGILKKLNPFRRPSKNSVQPFQGGHEEAPKEAAGQAPASPQPQAQLHPVSPASPAPASPLRAASPSRGSPAHLVSSPQAAAAAPSPGRPPVPHRPPLPTGAASPQKVHPPLDQVPAARETRAPSPADSVGTGGDSGPPDFDASIEEVYAAVGEAFGQMIASSLQSQKWDKRSQALKAVSAVLKGLDIQGMAKPGSTGVLGKGLRLRDRTRCWRASCLLLYSCMRDKVLPVRLAALELFTDTFSNAEGVAPPEEVNHALSLLLERLIDGLGDSNLRLHEGARKCVLFAAEGRGLLGLPFVLARLRARLEASPAAGRGGERTKVYFGVLDAVNAMLHHFPGRRAGDAADQDDDAPQAPEDSWTQHDIAPFVIAGMDDSLGVRVRNTAVALAVTVYQTLGGEAMQAILAELRPAKQALLKQKFQESEEEDVAEDSIEAVDHPAGPLVTNKSRLGSELSGLVVCGTGVKPTAVAMLPGVLNEEADEEYMMDGILEEAGMVFNGASMVAHDPQLRSCAGRHGVPGYFEAPIGLGGARDGRSVGIGAAGSPHYAGELSALEEEHWMLEEELLNLGMDLEGLEEQQALLCSLQEGMSMGRRGAHQEELDAGDEVAVLLNSLQQNDLSLSSLASVEAF